MPRGYERMVARFIAEGMSKKAAQAKAARIWNATHPNNPVGRGRHGRKRKTSGARRKK